MVERTLAGFWWRDLDDFGYSDANTRGLPKAFWLGVGSSFNDLISKYVEFLMIWLRLGLLYLKDTLHEFLQDQGGYDLCYYNFAAVFPVKVHLPRERAERSTKAATYTSWHRNE